MYVGMIETRFLKMLLRSFYGNYSDLFKKQHGIKLSTLQIWPAEMKNNFRLEHIQNKFTPTSKSSSPCPLQHQADKHAIHFFHQKLIWGITNSCNFAWTLFQIDHCTWWWLYDMVHQTRIHICNSWSWIDFTSAWCICWLFCHGCLLNYRPGVSKVFARRSTCGEMNICRAAFDYNTCRGPYLFYESSHAGRSKFDQGPHLALGPDFGHACYRPSKNWVRPTVITFSERHKIHCVWGEWSKCENTHFFTEQSQHFTFAPLGLVYTDIRWRHRMSFEISFMPPIGNLSFLFFKSANGRHETCFKWHPMAPSDVSVDEPLPHTAMNFMSLGKR